MELIAATLLRISFSMHAPEFVQKADQVGAKRNANQAACAAAWRARDDIPVEPHAALHHAILVRCIDEGRRRKSGVSVPHVGQVPA